MIEQNKTNVGYILRERMKVQPKNYRRVGLIALLSVVSVGIASYLICKDSVDKIGYGYVEMNDNRLYVNEVRR